MRWPHDVWLWRLISSGLAAPVLILSLSPKEIHRLLPWHPFTLRPSDSVCTALCLCAASLTHWDNVCISSYSQANPPPIIVNADSLDAGPYVSICSLSLCLYSICSSHSHYLCVSVCVFVHACVYVDVKGASWYQHAVFSVQTSIHYPTECAFCSYTSSITVHIRLVN